jgi:hypothetical protein
VRVLSLILALLAILAPVRTVHAEDAATQARHHYDSGVSLFEAGNKEQALIEFQIAHELSPKKENVFMVAQCEYHLGQLKDARAHYQAFLAEQGTGELANIARLRVEAINRRPGVFVINTVPDQVQVRIEGEGQTFTGEAPNEFRVPRGRYRVIASKHNFASQEREVSVDVAETKPLFFKLDPIPARLEIRTRPDSATLYVRGNRAQNPYVQQVEPGDYEVYAEAPYYLPRRDTLSLQPGQHLRLDFPLTYVQRSGRPELIGFWIGIGAIGGGMAVWTQVNPDPNQSVPQALIASGVLAGGIGAGVLAAALMPNYIRDNRAMFRIGATWIGDVEGMSLAMALANRESDSYRTSVWLGGVAGLTAGTVAGWWLDDQAPNYGRVAIIQSGAILGSLTGMLALSALSLDKDKATTEIPNPTARADRYGWGILAGLNAGLGVGLALAYLPDQRVYGPSWQRVVLIDLAAAAGAFAGGLVEICLTSQDSTKPEDKFCGSPSMRARTARYALAGGAIGLASGWLLTLAYDKATEGSSERSAPLPLPMPSAMPVQTSTGFSLVPGLMSQGRF